MIILACDQATKTGFSVFKDGKLLSYGLADYSKYKNVVERHNQIKQGLLELIERYNPDFVAIEDCQMQFSAQVFKTLAMLQGVLRDLCFELDLYCHVISPSEWRKAIGIKGRKREELKANTMAFVRMMYGLTGEKEHEDVSDAICIGYAVNKLVETGKIKFDKK